MNSESVNSLSDTKRFQFSQSNSSFCMFFCKLAVFAAFSCCTGDPIDVKQSANELKECEVHRSENVMKSVVLLSDFSLLARIHLNQTQLVYVDENLNLPGSVDVLEKRLRPLFLNKEINSNNLISVKNEILKHYNQHQQPLVVVEIPEQDVSSGAVVFVIQQARVGKVTYTGNRWYSSAQVAKKLSLHTGDLLDQDELLDNLSWLNQNPFHYTEAVLSPGTFKSASDIEIVTKDRIPLRVYGGGDNTGVESTGTSRFYGGLTWGNAFFIDDLLTFRFTSNASYHKYHSYSMDYLSFLPWKHLFSLYGGYAEIHPDISDFQSHGKEAQASFRYKIPFKPLFTNLMHQLYFGFDYKYVTSALFFVAELVPTAVINSIVNVTQGMLGYQLEYSPKQHEVSFCFELFGSPAKWLPHQDHHAYSSLRPHAKPCYVYGKMSLGDVYTFSTKDSISALLRVQGSANTLIPSEQFSLGGYNTVRGYEENVFISDNAVCANLELRTRPLTLFKSIHDEWSFLAFMDYGWGYNYHPFDGLTTAATLLGIGPGLRYAIHNYAKFRLDYGFKLHSVNFDDHTLGMWHVGGTLSY